MGYPQGDRKLSKNLTVAKVLIEELLCRRSEITSTNHEDVMLGMKLLNAVISQPRLLIIADGDRMARDFAYAMRRPYVFINDHEKTQGLGDCDIIILHTGGRTEKQKQINEEVMLGLSGRRNVTLWHVSEWGQFR